MHNAWRQCFSRYPLRILAAEPGLIPAVLLFLLRLQIQRRGIHAIAQPGGRRTILKHMPEMGAALAQRASVRTMP